MDAQMGTFENGCKTSKHQVENFDIVSSSQCMQEKTTMKETQVLQNGELNKFQKFQNQIEETRFLENQKVQAHRPLTLLRIIRGVLCLVVLFSTAFMTLIFLSPFSSVILRLFSIHYSREATSFLFHHWLGMWPFMFEKINKTKVVFAGHCVPPRERILLISNHRTEVDWMYLWNLAIRKDCLGYIKYIIKSSVRNVPLFGWGFQVLEFILIERKWELDKPVIESMLSTFKDPQAPLWLVIFPEGTDFTEQKCRQSQRFSEEHGLPVLNNVLLPRTKGFTSCLAHLRSSLDAVYDVTIAYKYKYPLFVDNVFGVNPAEVHIHVHRTPINEMPSCSDEVASWLIEAFHRKDELLSNFSVEGCFPNSGIEGELPTFKCLLNFIVMVIVTCFIFTFTIVSSAWLKIYAALSCVYFAGATYFNYRPTAVFRCLKEIMPHGKTHIP